MVFQMLEKTKTNRLLTFSILTHLDTSIKIPCLIPNNSSSNLLGWVWINQAWTFNRCLAKLHWPSSNSFCLHYSSSKLRRNLSRWSHLNNKIRFSLSKKDKLKKTSRSKCKNQISWCKKVANSHRPRTRKLLKSSSVNNNRIVLQQDPSPVRLKVTRSTFLLY